MSFVMVSIMEEGEEKTGIMIVVPDIKKTDSIISAFMFYNVKFACL